MIIDLDAHQGNGHERDHTNADKYYIIDAYNHNIYPNDNFAVQFIKGDIIVTKRTTDQNYLNEIRREMKKCFEIFKPQFVIYNAGTDCLANDPLGRLNISEQGIIDRDELVFEECRAESVPLVMVLSGGY